VNSDPETDKKSDKKEGDDSSSTIPLFRCTCYRSGEDHNFGSQDAAKEIGGAMQDKFNWTVKMKGFDIEVVVNIDPGGNCNIYTDPLVFRC
jgi:adenylyl- and sulfurtransferase ThiI